MQFKDLKYNGKGTSQGREQSNTVIWKQKKYSEAKAAWCYFIFFKNYLEETAKHQMLTYSRQEKIYIRIYFYLEQEKSTFVVEVQRQLFSKKKKSYTYTDN